ncbi:MAG: hypothetical protein AB7I33_03925 [Gemmatimonadales bacterium]
MIRLIQRVYIRPFMIPIEPVMEILQPHHDATPPVPQQVQRTAEAA